LVSSSADQEKNCAQQLKPQPEKTEEGDSLAVPLFTYSSQGRQTFRTASIITREDKRTALGRNGPQNGVDASQVVGDKGGKHRNGRLCWKGMGGAAGLTKHN